MKVAILGSGPAGMLAAHAAEAHEAVTSVDIFAEGRKSEINGAQYLHEHIEGVTQSEPTIISYIKLGESMGYAKKVYGSAESPSSWKHFDSGEHPAWPMAQAYDRLWSKHFAKIHRLVVIPADLAVLNRNYDLVLCSIPRKGLCVNRSEHFFKAQEVVFERQAQIEIPNVVVYSGRPEDDWYRTSLLFGHGSTEYSKAHDDIGGAPRPALSWVHGIKPIATDCDCHSEYEKMTFIGRFGKWEKGILTTDAYHTAKLSLEAVAHALY